MPKPLRRVHQVIYAGGDESDNGELQVYDRRGRPMKSVYIASPYGDDNAEEVRLKNAHFSMTVWHRLVDEGLAPYCPLLTHFLGGLKGRKREEWMRQTTFWLLKCDALLVLGDSPGVKQEVLVARRSGKPIFYTIEELLVSIEIEDALAAGEIDVAEYRRRMRELMRDYKDAVAEESHERERERYLGGF